MNTITPAAIMVACVLLFAKQGTSQSAASSNDNRSNSDNATLREPDQDARPPGIRAILLEKPKKGWDYIENIFGEEFSVFTLDSRTLAMLVDQATIKESVDAEWLNTSSADLGHDFLGLPYNWEYQEKPMYFDKEGFIYTKDKKRWVKTPFVIMKSMMKGMFNLTNGLFPNLQLPDGSVTYYGIDVSPDNYPILEWAFRYKVHYFEKVAELNKEFIDCREEGGCMKYTLMSGKDRGSYVLFDNQGRLAEISSINSGKIIYVYGDYTVTLPEARLVGTF